MLLLLELLALALLQPIVSADGLLLPRDCHLLLGGDLVLEGVGLCADGGVEEEDVGEEVVKHIGEVFDVALVDEPLLGVEVLDPASETGYSLVRLRVKMRAEETFPWKFLKRLMEYSAVAGGASMSTSMLLRTKLFITTYVSPPVR
jgi:hypothetical protein